MVGKASAVNIDCVVAFSDLDVGMQCTSPWLAARNCLMKFLWRVARLSCVLSPLLCVELPRSVKETVNFRCFSVVAMVTLAPFSMILSLVEPTVVHSWDGPVPLAAETGGSVMVVAVT